jgi:hypothetical protein
VNYGTEVPNKLALYFSLNTRMVSGQSKGGTLTMAKKTKRVKAIAKRAKKVATRTSAAASVRSKAAHRTAVGKFTKVIFNQIGGKECRRFAAMTWKERDAFMAKPENTVVRDRYEKHLASIQ